MLQLARDAARDVTFVHADIRTLTLPSSFDAAVCLFDSLNHLMYLDELRAACRNVRAALEPHAPFIVDFNMESGYQARWQGSFGIAKEDHALVGRSAYDPAAKVGELALTMFRLKQRVWRRTDLTLYQHCYSELEITGALKSAGFAAIEVHHADRDLGMPGHVGRSFFLARGR
jgi:SAM-dependent methyltransferase